MILEEIKTEFDDIVAIYNNDVFKDRNKDLLHEYSDRFTKLYKEIGPHCSETYGYRTMHDDKAASAIKARIARRLMETEKMTWNKAESLAAASQEYTDFLQERVFYYESWDSVDHLRNTIKQYIINIGLKISSMP